MRIRLALSGDSTQIRCVLEHFLRVMALSTRFNRYSEGRGGSSKDSTEGSSQVELQ